MEESLNKINTNLEARKLVKDPAQLFILLYSKYGDIKDDYYTSFTNQVMYKCSSHFSVQYREIKYNDCSIEFFRRFYKAREVIERIPNLYDYYKNYHLFYLKPILRNFYLENLLHNYQDKKAEIFYKNNYTRTSNDKDISDDNYVTSSLSSSDHYTDNKIIFNSKTKLLLDGNNSKDSSFLKFEVSKIKKNNNNSKEDLRLSIKTSEENTLNLILKELKKENKNNSSKNKKKNTKTKTQRNSGKDNSPKVHSKSPTFQMKHQIQVIKSTNGNLNSNYNCNLISPQLYILSHKNSHSKKKNNSHKNKIYFSPKPNYYLNNIASKFEEMFKKFPNYIIRIKHKRNKTGNNSINNTIKKSINNNNNNNNNCVNNNILFNNFQSNFKKFSKLSSYLKNNKFNITYFSQINSNNNSRNSMNGNKSNKLQKNKNSINEINQSNIKTKSSKYKKNKTYDFNMARGKLVELKKNYTNYNLLRFKPSPSNIQKPIGLNFNLIKSPKNDIIIRNGQGPKTNNNKNQKLSSGNKAIKKNQKSLISIASCSSPKISFNNNKNEVKDNNNLINLESNIYNFLNNNKKIITKLKKNKYKKNNVSYTNNNYNINFNNVYFCSSRPTSGPHSNNVISDKINTNGNIQMNKNINNNLNNMNNLTSNNSSNLNNKKNITINKNKNNILNSKNNNNCNNNISNLYVKSLNNLYNFSRNKNYKISNCSQTQTQSQSIVKNSKIIKISESKIPVNKTNSFILHCNNNIIDEKNANKITKNNRRAKMMNQIEDLIMKSKKNIKFGSEHKSKKGSIISNKPAFNNCNNKNKNQTQNKSKYHEMIIKNLKRTSSTSIKVNIKSNGNNNQAINVIYKK